MKTIKKSAIMVLAIAAGAILPTFADRTLNDGLVAYLPFDNSMTENAVAGSPVAPEASTATAPALENNGMVGKCLNIPSGAYVKLTGSDTSSLTFEDSNKSFTAIIWAKFGSQTDDPLIFCNKMKWGGVDRGVLLCAQSNSQNAQFNAGTGRSGAVQTQGQDRFDKYFTGEGSGKWTFYAMVCNNGTFYCYQGKSDGTISSQTATLSKSGYSLATDYPFVLAQQGNCAYGKTFTGQLDDFALWTRALSDADIRRIYEFGRSGAALGNLLKMDAYDAPEMDVTKNSETQYTLTFGGRRTETHALYVAYGANDGEEDKYAWDSFEKLADIPAGTTSYTYNVPDALFAINARFRFFLMQTNSLPYVKEVAYAHSDGTAYFNSGIAPRRELIAEFNLKLTADNGVHPNFFGAFTVSGTNNDAKRANYGMCRYYNPGNSNNNKWDREYNTGKACQFVGNCVLDTDYHVVFSTTNLVVDGTAYGSGITLTEFVEGGYGIAVYRNEKVGSQYDETMIGYFKDFSLYTPKRKVRGYVPVVDAGGTVGMFDSVTGQFTASAGTALTAGADQDTARFGWVRCVSEPHLASATIPFTATYTGAGTDPLDFTDGANWNCTNAFGFALSADTVPAIDTDVTVSGVTVFQAVKGCMMFVCKSLKFDNATLPDNADIRGLDFSKVTSDSVIYLQGRTLFLADETSAALSAFTITDASQGAPGTVRVSVASGTLSNSSVALAGNLRLQKEGAGIFVPAKASQTYTGGTDISNGTIRVNATVSGHLGTGVVAVPSGASFDMYGKDVTSVMMVLAGGTLKNSANSRSTLPKYLTLTENSTIQYAGSNGSNDMTVPNLCEWNLGGKTLSVAMTGDDSDFDFTANGPNVISNGTMTVTVGTAGVKKGYFAIRSLKGEDGLKLDIGTTWLRLNQTSGNSSVEDFTANPPSGSTVTSVNRMFVRGRFTPQTAMGFNMTMMNGSTLDLSKMTGSYNCVFTNPNGYVGTGTVKYTDLQFDSGAKVKVALGDRTKEELKTIISDDGLIVKWSSEPAANVEFSLDDATFARGFRIKRVTGGLKLLRSNGLTIIVK